MQVQKMISEVPVLVLVVAVVAFSGTSTSAETSSGDDQHEGPLLSTFKGVHRELIQHPDGTYRFSFSLPQQERQETRDADGKVTGSFSFVDNSGEEVSVKYNADEEGFRPESDALPEIPQDTDDVQSAREQFLRYYEQTVKFLNALGSDEESDESSSSSEESDEDEESNESDDDDDDDDDSESESESDEDSEEEDSEEEDEEEEEGGEEEDEEEGEESIRNNNKFFSFSPQSKSNRVFGNRVKKHNLSRTPPAKQEKKTKTKAVFPPVPAAASYVFGRRLSVKGQ